MTKTKKIKRLAQIISTALIFCGAIAQSTQYCNTIDSIENKAVVDSQYVVKAYDFVPVEVHIEDRKTIMSAKDEIEVVSIPEIVEEVSYYTEEDVIAMAHMAYGEAFSTGSDTERSACMWVVLNRLDSGDPFFAECDSPFDIITQKYQFYGYKPDVYPLDEHLVWLARDVLDRWVAEKNGATDVGRTLPKEYCFFWGDGRHNHFTTEHQAGIEYDWSLDSPYET